MLQLKPVFQMSKEFVGAAQSLKFFLPQMSFVIKFLQRKHATSRNLLFASDDTAELQKAFDPHWESAVPYTVLIAPGGQVLFSTTGSVDMLELRRKILASVPAAYIGFQKYWVEN